jgi:hypothetical protein
VEGGTRILRKQRIRRERPVWWQCLLQLDIPQNTPQDGVVSTQRKCPPPPRKKFQCQVPRAQCAIPLKSTATASAPGFDKWGKCDTQNSFCPLAGHARHGNRLDESAIDLVGGSSSDIYRVVRNSILAGALPRDEQSGLYMVLTAGEVFTGDGKGECGWHDAYVATTNSTKDVTFRCTHALKTIGHGCPF